MTGRPPRQSPRPRSLRSGAFCFLAALGPLLGPADLGGQEPDTLRPAPPDTLPRPLVRDSLLPEARQDTAGQDTTAQDTIPPPPAMLPELGPSGPPGWDRGVWEWDRDALLRLPDLSLLQLLERVPGVVPVRVDLVSQAESGAVFGATAGAIRYVLDGFELDPLVSPTFDPSRFPLLALERVRVERRVTGITVHMETRTPDDGRTRSVIEAGTGDYGVNLFRGTFLAPRVVGGPLGLGFERLAAGGFLPGGGSNHTTTWLKWSWVHDSAGVQVELKRSEMDRSGIEPGLVGSRTDWAVRARGALGPVTGEGFIGGASVEDERGEIVLRESTPQGGVRLRAHWVAPVPLDIAGALRLRSHPRLPAREAELGLRLEPLPAFAVEVEASQGWWSEGDPTGRWTARGVVGPVLGISLFAELDRGGALIGDGPGLRMPPTTGTEPAFRVSREGVRAGARFHWGGLAVGGAALRARTDTVHPFGLATEAGWGRVVGPLDEAAETTGFEATARIPTLLRPLWLEGWYVQLDAPAGWLYTPHRQWRAALVYHHLPLPSGNLELYARVEHAYRGYMAVPRLSAVPGELLTRGVGEYRATNAELVIRVLTVRAFLRWENLGNRPGQADLAGFDLPGQHILYGVKWEFWN